MTREKMRAWHLRGAGCRCLPALVFIFFSPAALEMQKGLITLLPPWNLESDPKVIF